MVTVITIVANTGYVPESTAGASHGEPILAPMITLERRHCHFLHLTCEGN